MRFQRSILTATVVFFVLALAGRVSPQSRISLTWDVVRYDLNVSLPSNPNSVRDLDVNASLTIKNISSGPFSRLTLRISDQAKVSSVTANGAVADFSTSPESTGGTKALQRVITRLPSVAPGQTAEVVVKYKLNVKENDGLAAISDSGSQFLPYSFWYPTPTSWFYTGGADFAPFKITVSGAGNAKVLSSGNGAGSVFEQNLRSQPFFLAGPYEVVDEQGVEIAYIRRGSNPVSTGRLSELASLMKKANEFIGGKLGLSLNTPLRIVLVKRGAGFTDAGTVLLDDRVLIREKIDSQVVQSIAEGIAKSYLGNAVSVEGDGYGVIREGLSRFLSNEFIEVEFGEAVADVERLQQRTNYSAISRRDAPLNVVSPVDGYYYTATANKGAVIWSYLATGAEEDFLSRIKQSANDGKLELSELRSAFSSEKAYLDYTLDRITEMNLMVGLPQKANGVTKSALRNLGEIDAKVAVTATTSSGKKLTNNVTIKARDFGEAVFTTTEDIVRVEVDQAKIYPQLDYSDDVAPRVIDEQDPLLFIKREFDRQKYSETGSNALAVLRMYPAYHDARILLARSLLADGKLNEAGAQYREVLQSALPSSQSLAWAELGLGEIAMKSGQASEAGDRFRKAVSSGSEYGATLGAVRNLITLKAGPAPDDAVRAYFSNFDRAVVANSKAEVQAIIAGGEVSRFAVNVAGQAQQWTTRLEFVQEVDSVDILVAANVELKLLNREIESGVALFRLTRTSGGLKLSAVEIFEVN